MTDKRWKIRPAIENPELVEEFCRSLSVQPLTAKLLIQRGHLDTDSASSFLTPNIKELHDPFLLLGMDKAVTRLAAAVTSEVGAGVDSKERIALYGDYDVDGTTSVWLMTLFFNELGVNPLCHIPDRVTEGYGLNTGAIKELAGKCATIIITADCGSTNHKEVAYAKELGVDVIITDHHELPGGAPGGALATINPKQRGCAFPFKGLCGVGVAFNLVIALRARLREAGFFESRNEPNLMQYLDLVAVGTVADMVPLVEENRLLVSLGLKVLARGNRPGLKALMESAGIKPSAVDSRDIGFKIGPRINAAGRVASATIAYRLLITGDIEEAEQLAARLESENASRRELEAVILAEAIEMVESEGKKERAIVLYSEKWHPGVIGIVASRLVERYNRPVVMIAVGNGIGKGSVRSIKSVDVVAALGVCSALLIRFGGHRAAAGLTVDVENIGAFKAAFTEHFNATLTDDDLIGELELDAAVELGDIDLGFAAEVERLAPFGMANREPLLCLKGVSIDRTEVLKSRHLRLFLSQNGEERKAIGFNMAEKLPLSGTGYSVAFSTGVNEWRGVKSADIKVKGLKRS